MKRSILAAALIAGTAGAMLLDIHAGRADYQAGVAAAERGDHARALDEFRRAAEAGDARAQFRLAQAYERGENVLQDFVIAHMWLNLAASQGHDKAAEARDALAKRMTPEQLARAQDLARQRLAMAAPAPSPAAAAPGRAIGKEEIATVQRRLAALGYKPGPADGVMGARTRTALKAWQREGGLPETGEIDTTVLARIVETGTTTAAAPPPPAPPPAAARQMSQREQTRAVQQALDAAGYDAGPADGIMGSRTREAIRAYQRANAMPVTGELSPQLLAGLNVRQTTVTTTTTTTTTSAALPADTEAERTLREGGRLSSYVRSVQEELADHGYWRGAIDGAMSDRLRTAIREYQDDAGLRMSGTVSEDLLDHLRYARPEVTKQQAAGRR